MPTVILPAPANMRWEFASVARHDEEHGEVVEAHVIAKGQQERSATLFEGSATYGLADLQEFADALRGPTIRRRGRQVEPALIDVARTLVLTGSDSGPYQRWRLEYEADEVALVLRFSLANELVEAITEQFEAVSWTIAGAPAR